MGYAEVLAELSQLRRFGVRPALEPTRDALARLGNPQAGLRIVHVAGTNGKGSTAAMIDSILRQAGFRTGLYTSPHLSRFTERARIDGREIPRDDVVRLARRTREVGPDLTFFETATCVALQHFAERNVDVAVLETGLGGRLDATNVVDPAVTIVTRIGLDHTPLLGTTIEEVAGEKAGIFKTGRPALVWADGPERDVFVGVAKRVGAPLQVAGEDFDAWSGVLRLPGPHQRENATLAAETARRLGVADDAIARGLERVRWPGRLERIGRFVLDCAHNPQAAAALTSALGNVDALIFGCLADKNAGELIRALPPAGATWLVRPRGDRAQEPDALIAACPKGKVTTLEDALERAEGETVLIAGSIYLVGQAREVLLHEEPDPLPVSDPAHRGTT